MARIVAVLHDVIEDTDVRLDDLERSGFDPAVIGALDRLTKRSAEAHEDCIRRLAPDEIAHEVKLAEPARQPR